MAHISEYRKLSSKLEALKEKVKFQNAVVELSQALIAEANYITTDKLTALKYLVKAYNQGLALQSPNYVGKTWDDFKYSYNFKVTVEKFYAL